LRGVIRPKVEYKKLLEELEEIEKQIEKLRQELEQKSGLAALKTGELKAGEVLQISEKLDALINQYLRLKGRANENQKKDK